MVDRCLCADAGRECPTCDLEHRRRMDAYWHERNRGMLARAEAILAQPTGTWIDEMRARALLKQFVDEEQQRLTEKLRWTA